MAADATAGTITFDWAIVDDTCIYELPDGDSVTDDECHPVDIFLDP